MCGRRSRRSTDTWSRPYTVSSTSSIRESTPCHTARTLSRKPPSARFHRVLKNSPRWATALPRQCRPREFWVQYRASLSCSEFRKPPFPLALLARAWLGPVGDPRPAASSAILAALGPARESAEPSFSQHAACRRFSDPGAGPAAVRLDHRTAVASRARRGTFDRREPEHGRGGCRPESAGGGDRCGRESGQRPGSRPRQPRGDRGLRRSRGGSVPAHGEPRGGRRRFAPAAARHGPPWRHGPGRGTRCGARDVGTGRACRGTFDRGVFRRGGSRGSLAITARPPVRAGVIVHVVAIGDPEHGHPVPSGTGDQPLSYQGEKVLSRRVDTFLEAIAQETDGAVMKLGLAAADLKTLYRTRIAPVAQRKRAAG